MISIQDDRGYNQGFKPGRTMRIRTERRVDYIHSFIDDEKPGSILEIGCGTGEISYMLAQRTRCQVTGVDICEPFIEEARHTYSLENLKFQLADFNKPTNETGKFDYIVGNGILHHLYPDLENAMRKIRNLLNEQGKIIFLEPNLYNPYCFLIFNSFDFLRKAARLEPDEMALTRKKMKRILKQTGYQEIEIEYRDFLIPNTPSFLVKPVIILGSLFEKLPLFRMMSQSIFIRARR